MTGSRHALDVDYQMQQARKVRRLEAANSIMREALRWFAAAVSDSHPAVAEKAREALTKEANVRRRT